MNVDPQKARSIFLAAVENYPPDQWGVYLDQPCGNDPDLRRRVEELLHAHEQANSIFDTPAPGDEAARFVAATVEAPLREAPGTVIGPYKLLEQIGEGGFGAVFMAEQQKPLRRKVALKILKPGMDSRQVIARFEAERQALAIMDHPNIAKVLDAGEIPGLQIANCKLQIEKRGADAASSNLQSEICNPQSPGRPYFVMELVKGQSITDFCDQNQYTPRQRLELFVSVCQAVQHAHQKGIIHRDLKPSNVLVTMQDGTPLVKVIDFGIAKALGQQLTDKTMFTGFAQMVGTPAYMSPEQVALSNVDVDTRSDVYSLGVLLYELLTGTTPFPKERLKEISYDELRRIIREEEPPKPSTRITTLGQASTTISTQRKSDPKRLSLLLRGELDWIVMKALDKDRDRRYESASAFAADVQHYLNNEAVQACPPSAAYRFRKFARRNKVALAFTGSILFFVMVLAGGIAWTLGERSARHEVAEAKVREGLDTADARLRQGNPWDPALIAAVEQVKSQLGNLGSDPGLRQQVEEMLRNLEMVRDLEEAQLQLAAVKDGERDYEGTDAAYLAAFGKYKLDVDLLDPKSAAEQIQAQAVHRQLVGALDDWAYIRKKLSRDGWKNRLAVARVADRDALRQRLRDALEGKDQKVLEELAGAKPTDDWPVATLVLLGKLAEDSPSAGRVAALLEKVLQRHPPGDFWINQTLGILLSGSRPPRLEEAIRFYSVAVALRPQSPVAHVNLGRALHKKGRLDEAIAELREALRLNKDFPSAHLNLGICLIDKSQLDQAIAEFREAVRLRKDYPDAHGNLGAALQEKGRLDEAIAELREAIRLRKDYPEAHYNLGRSLKEKGQLEDAITEYREAIRLKKDLAEAHVNLGGALVDKGQIEEGIAECREAIRLKKDFPVAHCNLGSGLLKKGQLEEAIAEFREAIRLEKDNSEAHNNLGLALFKKGLLDEGITEFREAVALKKNNTTAQKNLAVAHLHLGVSLSDKGQLNEAMAEYRKAIRVRKDYPQAHNSLGIALQKLGRLDEAITEFREVLRLVGKEDYPVVHLNLGNALGKKGQLDQAIAEYREGLNLEKNNPDLLAALGTALMEKGELDKAIAEFRKALRFKKDYVAVRNNLGKALAQKGDLEGAIAEFREALRFKKDLPVVQNNLELVLQKKRLLDFETRLPQLLKGEQQPKDTGERISLAQFCQEQKNLYAAAARWYAEVFAAEPGLARDPQNSHRYDAACAAALAGCGQGKDAAKLDDKEKRRLRDQALAWLRADLELFDKQHRAGDLPGVLFLIDHLAHAQKDPDFKGVRDSLAALPESEQAAWRKLWADTGALLKQARAALSQTTLKGVLTDKTHQQSHDQRLEAGKEYVIDMKSSVFDTFLKLLDPKGKLVAENDDIAPPNNLNSRVIFTPKESGTYRIVATSFEERGRGAYTVTIRTMKGKLDKKSP